MKRSQDHSEHKFQQWLDGELSQAEWETFKGQTPDKAHLEEREKTILHMESWEMPVPKLSTEEAWGVLQDRIGRERSGVVPLWKKPAVMGIAATLLVLICVWVFWGRGDLQIYSPQGSHLSYTLPDQSAVTLNADSRISFKAKGFKKNRQVKLEGEAFFEIERGSQFIVESNYGTVQVLGTSFNIYSREDRFEVACVTGKVAVMIPGQDSVILKAGMATLLRSQQLVVRPSIGEDRSLEWKQGDFYFTDTRLTLVLDELKRQLDLVIVTKSPLDDKIYSGFFNRNNKESALQSVLEPMGLKYQIHGDTVLIE